jgi:hypothetical protein
MGTPASTTGPISFKNLNPEGSLNFSSPVRARGPFNSAHKIGMSLATQLKIFEIMIAPLPIIERR